MKSNDRKISCTLFFTRGVSLRTWDRGGMFDREVALYLRLREKGVKINFVTYGDRDDFTYSDRIHGITILCNRWNLPANLYEKLLPILHASRLWHSQMFKTNQTLGADVALRASKLFKKKVIARSGYLLSVVTEHRHGLDSVEARRVQELERHIFSSADRVVVTAPAMKNRVTQRYNVPTERVRVIPNYVDTEVFRPQARSEKSHRRLCFVGRMDEEKNPFALLEAIKGLDVELVMVGNGSLRGRLQAAAERNGLLVSFPGNVQNAELPSILNSAALFVLPSFYEGHPKTLIEAMACGIPVVGTDVPGIRELISHRENGFLCGTSPDEIRQAIQYMLNETKETARMVRKAREFAVGRFALDQVAEKELALLEELTT